MKTLNLLRRITADYFRPVMILSGVIFFTFSAGGQVSPPQKDNHGNYIQAKRQSSFMVFGSDSIYISAEKNPAYPGGQKGLEQFKMKNLKYPSKAKKAGFEGTVQVNFIIEKDGNLSHIRIVSGASPSLDAEAIRIAKSIPAWQPGMEGGRPVRFAYATPFNFLLNPDKYEEITAMGSFAPPPSGTSKIDEETPFVVVEEMPLFPGGDEELLKHIALNTKYPENAKANNIQGRVILRFCVTNTGSVNRISILRGVNHELDAEAVRVVSELPRFTPGKQGGKAVNVWYMVPITFALSQKNTGNEKSEAPTQTEAVSKPPEYPVTGYDEAPVFKGGEAAIKKFITRNLVYPPSAVSKGLSGKVIVNYCIGTQGKVEAATVYQGIDPELDAEALRVIKILPAFQPAKLEGKPVHVWYQIPVTFN